MKSNLERFWSIVGENGCLLTPNEKRQMIMILCTHIPYQFNDGEYATRYSNIGDIFNDSFGDYGIGMLSYFYCNPPMNGDEELFATIFNFKLTKQECLEAISKISTAEYNKGIFKND